MENKNTVKNRTTIKKKYCKNRNIRYEKQEYCKK